MVFSIGVTVSATYFRLAGMNKGFYFSSRPGDALSSRILSRIHKYKTRKGLKYTCVYVHSEIHVYQCLGGRLRLRGTREIRYLNLLRFKLSRKGMKLDDEEIMLQGLEIGFGE